jgi:hypothetical protein
MGKSVGIKMYGVKGKKIMPGHEDVEEMDMLFNNAPGFFCPDMVCFSALVTELARNPLPAIPTGKTGEEFGEYMEKGFGPILMAWGGKDPQFMEALQRLMAENEASAHSGHLGAYKFWAQAPFAYGEGKAAKFSLYPDNAAAYGIDKYPLEDGNFYLKNFRKSIVENKTPLKYKLYVQFQEDTCTEPIEDGSANWQTKEHHIGTFTFSDAVTDDEDRTCQNIGFQPYLVTEHFKPLGGLNRGRLDAYTRVIKMRQGYNLYRTMPKGALAETNAQKGMSALELCYCVFLYRLYVVRFSHPILSFPLPCPHRCARQNSSRYRFWWQYIHAQGTLNAMTDEATSILHEYLAYIHVGLWGKFLALT